MLNYDGSLHRRLSFPLWRGGGGAVSSGQGLGDIGGNAPLHPHSKERPEGCALWRDDGARPHDPRRLRLVGHSGRSARHQLLQ